MAKTSLYKLQRIKDGKWIDMGPIPGISTNKDLTYHEAISLASDYKGLTGTKNYRHTKQ